MIWFKRRVLTMIVTVLRGLPASSQVAAPAGTTNQPARDARRMTSQTSSMDPGVTVSGDGQEGDAGTGGRGDAEMFASPTMVVNCLATSSRSKSKERRLDRERTIAAGSASCS